MKSFAILILIPLFFGCNRSLDYSNPKEVVNEYQKQLNEGKIDKAFKLVSDSSKRIVMFQEFKEYYSSKFDSIKRNNTFIVKDVKQMPIDINYPNYRSFEIKEAIINKLAKDTFVDYSYLRTINEGKILWKVVWVKQLEREATQLEIKSKYEDALNVCNKIINYDPINGEAYLIKAWINYRLGNNRLLEEYGLKGLDLAPNNAQSHVIMAAIYDTKGLYESAKLSNRKALLFTNDSEQKSQIYSNTSIYCTNLNQNDSAIYYLRKAISINSKTHALWRLAINYTLENNIDSSLYYFEKAIKNEPMDHYLQLQLYNDYSKFLIKYANGFPKGSEDQKSSLFKAKNLSLKSLDLDPNDIEAKLILDKINSY